MSQSTLVENVAAALRQSIYNGGHASGERLVELTLADEMNVSQNTVREALRVLEQEGLVIKHTRRGVYVRSFTFEEAAELYELWEHLESLALRWLLTSVDDGALLELREIVAEARSQVAARNARGAVESILMFHEAVGQNSGRVLTMRLLGQLLNQVRLLENVRQISAPRSPAQRREYLEMHETLLRAIETREAARAQQSLSDFLQRDAKLLREAL